MKILDLRGVISPFALLKVSNMFREMADGECLEILWNGPDLSSIVRILPPKTYDLLIHQESEASLSFFRVKIYKKV